MKSELVEFFNNVIKKKDWMKPDAADWSAFLILLDNSNLIKKARDYATQCHDGTNHQYNGKSYTTHLNLVYTWACRYVHLTNEHLESILAACWTHDVIEDCRQTYNDVLKATSLDVADITYALTNEKGKNRKERANDKYYSGIRTTPNARFVKICDRLANVEYSYQTGSSFLDTYRKEQPHFVKELYQLDFKPMFDSMEFIFKQY